MQLFRRVLLSLFPDDIVGQSVNPASMFISFISTKDFFSVINRKIVENYKLNLFDVTIDPFEFKIWFGENIPVKTKDVDMYYSYCATASLNGYRFFSPANIANSMSLVAALYVKDIFRSYPPEYYLNFLYTIFLLHFVFLARVKIFPSEHRETNYNRCIDVFFAFYAYVFQQTGQSADPKLLLEIKKTILNQTEIFFVLLSTYQHCNQAFAHRNTNDKDMYAWLFYDELKSDKKQDFHDFIEHASATSKEVKFSTKENKILQHILPADILLRYLFLENDMFLITESIIAKLYDKKILDGFMSWFRKQEAPLEDFLLYITDYRHFKKKFFAGVQKYIITIFKDADQWEIGEDMDDFMSSIGEDVENIDSFKIPERIKKESKLMEKILNFYITLIGWLRVSRGDNYFLRLYRPKLIQDILKDKIQDEKNYTLMYYGSLLYQYGKNVFYYKFTSDNVRAGKQKFILPNKPTSKNIYSNTHLLKSFDEHFLSVILQDINPKDIRIYLKHKWILDAFKALLGKQVSDLVTSKPAKFIETVYGSIAQHLDEGEHVVSTLKKQLTTNDLFHIKENVYSIDFWVSQTAYHDLHGNKLVLSENYSDAAILGILAQIRETLRWFLLYRAFLQSHKTSKQNNYVELLTSIYVQEILHLDEYYYKKFVQVIDRVTDTFQDIIQLWLELDDNKEYLRIGMDNRMAFTHDKQPDEIMKKCNGEDFVRLAWFLKNITYYNKRFLIPK